ncbi:MAG: NAD(P)H-hydrate dehydratase [Oscillospiraceae bacterium]|nr:NAD(P)H-hydrate dehydratase [Oscillospiraceae bacterium]
MPEAIPLRADALRLPRRSAESHKGDYGRLLILGGCVGYTGAPTLCARAAVRGGAGLVYLGVPAPIYNITAVKNDEAMPFPLPADADGRFSPAAADAALARLRSCDVCAVGPGMGRGAGGVALMEALLQSDGAQPLVIDADGLNALSGRMELLHRRRAPTVLTPHDGEFLRLGGDLCGSRTAAAQRFAEEHGCILILKGHRSLAAFPDGTVYRNTCGNPGMAKGGSGDVLTGVLAAMLGQLPVRRAVLTGLFLHSFAGDLCCARFGEYAMTASDLIETLPEATAKLLEEA